MKKLVLCLLLFNLGLLLYFQYENTSTHLTHITLAPLQPEKLKILTEAEIKALPNKADTAEENTTPTADPVASAVPIAEVTPPPATCYNWGVFTPKQVPRVSALLDKHLLQYTVKTPEVNVDERFWVYIPPKATQEIAQAKVEELKRLGVEDSFIVQDPPWRFAISFGVFKDEQLANKLLEDLKSKGVRTAVKGVRNQDKGNANFYITNMSLDVMAELDKVKASYAGAELKQVTCE